MDASNYVNKIVCIAYAQSHTIFKPVDDEKKRLP